MKTSIIICEFNPLHFGHKKLIDFAKSFSDKVVCVMSGNFAQRGMPACCNKYLRATHAVKAGADLVVELPTVFAVSSAENFAQGGVKIANALKGDFLVFGSECGDLDGLRKCARMLDDDRINERIRQELARGVAYPKAVALATGSELLEKPNNVLAIEYLRALEKTHSAITPVTLSREDNFHGAPQQFASSSALRNDSSLRKEYTFDFVSKDIDDSIEEKYCEFATRFLATVDKEYLESIAGVTEGLHNRIFNADKSLGFEKMIEEIKTKRYTRLRLQRVVLNCILGITKDAEKQAKVETPKIKALAVRSAEAQLLANVENESDEITKKADRLFRTFDGSTPPQKLLKIDF